MLVKELIELLHDQTLKPNDEVMILLPEKSCTKAINDVMRANVSLINKKLIEYDSEKTDDPFVCQNMLLIEAE